ncbi:hypothetical protein [Legionella fallonii]|uniref:Uncharacterized protein n=1 Tax=Legionella fallonii LLAP-10 TaxID=1212491 RepID=A0A098G8T6_9GAMM|nr:hypothetical protein [Legionella fallonii]CEG58888.1 conserved protein of unknown function [Legionella fallonii LLAP-10]
MPYINSSLLKNIPEYLRDTMAYYPDVILWQLNEIQYNNLWNQLISARYLYTNGYEIRPTNWFMYVLQTIKGWLGFENYCHPEKVSYTLNKLAYYGYTKQFPQPDFLPLSYYHRLSEVKDLVVRNYNDLTTAQLQCELIKSYFRLEPHLNVNSQRLNPHHQFGESWAKINAFALIPQLDPQNDSLIAEVIAVLDQSNISPTDIVFLPNSKYAQAAACYYCNKAQNTPIPSFLGRLFWTDPRPDLFAKALVYDPEIAKNNVQSFIEHHIAQREYQSAFNLIDSLTDSKLILNYLLTIPQTERLALIQKDSSIAAILVKYHLEKKQYTLAQQLYSNIEEISPEASFSIAIEEKNYVKAYDVFKRHESTIVFSTSERQKLAQIFFDAAEKKYDLAKNHRAKKEWNDALQNYHFSLIQKKAAHHLNPTEKNLEEVYIHKRLYAKALIDADLDLYQPEQSDIATIKKAITLLRECHSTDKEEQCLQTVALANGLMRHIDTLRETISFSYPPTDLSQLNEHKNKHQQAIATFIKTLKELITLLEGTKDKELCLKLGKAHFLLADAQLYFDITAADINQHYQMAMQAVPENPFYTLRVAELFETEKDKLQPIGVDHLKKMGYQVIDYVHWFDERWVKRDDIIYDIKDIHQPAVKPSQANKWSLGF